MEHPCHVCKSNVHIIDTKDIGTNSINGKKPTETKGVTLAESWCFLPSGAPEQPSSGTIHRQAGLEPGSRLGSPGPSFGLGLAWVFKPSCGCKFRSESKLE